MRASIASSSVGGSSSSPFCDQLDAPRRRRRRVGSSCTSSDRTPGGDVDDSASRRGRPASASRAWTRARRARSRAISPYSTSTKASPDRRIGERRPVAAGAGCWTSTPDAGSRRAVEQQASVARRPQGADDRRRVRRRASSARGGRERARTRTVSPGASWPELPPLGAHHRGRAGEAAEAGAVGAEQHRRVAGEVDGAEGVAGVVDVRRVQAGLAAVGPGPRRLRARRGARRCGRSGPARRHVGGEEGRRCRRR